MATLPDSFRRAVAAAHARPAPRRTYLPPDREARFQSFYANEAARNGLDPNPDAPEHHYDYRGAYAAGETPNAERHWSSAFKDDDHPRRYLPLDGIPRDTITDAPVSAAHLFFNEPYRTPPRPPPRRLRPADQRANDTRLAPAERDSALREVQRANDLPRMSDSGAAYAPPDPEHTPLQRGAIGLADLVAPGAYQGGRALARVAQGDQSSWGDLALNAGMAALPFAGVRGMRGERAPSVANGAGAWQRPLPTPSPSETLSDLTEAPFGVRRAPNWAPDEWAYRRDPQTGVLEPPANPLTGEPETLTGYDRALLNRRPPLRLVPPEAPAGSPDIAADPLANARRPGMPPRAAGPQMPNEDRYLFGRPDAPRTPPDAGRGWLRHLRDQGFDTETPLYHGTNRNIENVDRPLWATSDPNAASEYALDYRDSNSANVLPIFGRQRNPLIVHDVADLEEALGPDAYRLRADSGDMLWEHLDDPEIQDALKRQGYDAVQLPRDYTPMSSGGKGRHSSVLFLNPENVAPRFGRAPATPDGGAGASGPFAGYAPARDVAGGDTRKFSERISGMLDRGEFTEADVPLRSLTATQRYERPDLALAAEPNQNAAVPVVVRQGGRDYIYDGHTRLAIRAARDGADSARVSIVDLDGGARQAPARGDALASDAAYQRLPESIRSQLEPARRWAKKKPFGGTDYGDEHRYEFHQPITLSTEDLSAGRQHDIVRLLGRATGFEWAIVRRGDRSILTTRGSPTGTPLMPRILSREGMGLDEVTHFHPGPEPLSLSDGDLRSAALHDMDQMTAVGRTRRDFDTRLPSRVFGERPAPNAGGGPPRTPKSLPRRKPPPGGFFLPRRTP